MPYADYQKRIAKNNERQKRLRKTDPEFRKREKATQWRYLYKLAPDVYAKMLSEQDNRCAVCKEIFIKPPKVDHDHTCCSGKRSCGKCVRGLLCLGCNAALGNLKDSILALESAIVYLKRSGKDM
jgi:hypothetical protein